jgi:hypothetical protein
MIVHELRNFGFLVNMKLNPFKLLGGQGNESVQAHKWEDIRGIEEATL